TAPEFQGDKDVDGIAKFDITLAAVEQGETHYCYFEYATKLFKKETIERISLYYHKILRQVLEEPGRTIAEIEMISEEEKKHILYDFNRPGTQYPGEKIIHRLFEEQVGKTPDQIAVVSNATSGITGTVTYGQLNKRANRWARKLREKDVEDETLVGIMMEPSIEMVTGILAILKAGAAYIPLDPDYPRHRIEYILKDSGLKHLIVGKKLTSTKETGETFDAKRLTVKHKPGDSEFTGHQVEPGELDANEKDAANRDSLNLETPNKPGNLAYIIYTSGTTGRPKGVMVEHCNAVNVLNWFGREYGIRTGIQVLQLTDFTFDPSVEQVFGTLFNGATLHIVDRGIRLDMEKLRQYIEKNQVNIVDFVPAMLKEMMVNKPRLATLKVIISGGEKLEEPLKEKILQAGYNLYNHYGPTETSIEVLTEKCTEAPVTLGKPISNTRVYILNKHSRLQPVGIPGELCVAGAGVARGYLNNPEMTSEKFVKNSRYYALNPNNQSLATDNSLPPNNQYPIIENHLYRTGDLARWQPGGNIEFLGRIDTQVKLRGYRIELGEIENRLTDHDEIKETAVQLREGETGDKFLCAYIVPQTPQSTQTVAALQPKAIKEYLAQTLPPYMIPAYFVQLDTPYITSNGKIDKKALPAPEIKTGVTYVAPRGNVQETLAEIWAKVLGLEKEKIGIDDNFFRMGGHSLNATRMVSQVHKELNAALPLAEIFKTPRIRELAAYLEETVKIEYKSIEPAEKREYYDLSSAQKRLYILQQMEPQGIGYNMPEIIPIGQDLHQQKLEETFTRIIQRHESLRTTFHLNREQPVQRIHENVEFKIEQYEIKREGAPDRETPATAMKTFVRPFDLTQAPLLRVGLVKTGTRYHLIIDLHHIVSDGISHTLMKGDFIALYKGETVAPLRIQ
ncbi:MAG: amino acid adenylation domain-containing protein, partial [bacterium]|nr:amino acid adenylation domain-containing protein [bacterium]